jgi:hypothetical protein
VAKAGEFFGEGCLTGQPLLPRVVPSIKELGGRAADQRQRPTGHCSSTSDR